MRVNPNTFDFHGNNLRTIQIDGEPWFVGGDALHILFGRAQGKGDAYGKLDTSEKRKMDRIALGMKPGRPSYVVSESGLYKLIMRSDTKKAKPFQDWVTKDVLPSIRKTGGYLLNEEARSTAHADTREAMPLPAEILQLFSKLTDMMVEQTKTRN